MALPTRGFDGICSAKIDGSINYCPDDAFMVHTDDDTFRTVNFSGNKENTPIFDLLRSAFPGVIPVYLCNNFHDSKDQLTLSALCL